MKKSIIERTCIICNKKFSKRDLHRIVRTQSSEIFYDSTGKAEGRGIYVCPNLACKSTLKNKQGLVEKKLSVKINSPTFEHICEEIVNAKK